MSCLYVHVCESIPFGPVSTRTVFLFVIPNSQVDILRRFGRFYGFHLHYRRINKASNRQHCSQPASSCLPAWLTLEQQNQSSTFLRNVCEFLPGYTISNLHRPASNAPDSTISSSASVDRDIYSPIEMLPQANSVST